MAIDRRAVSQRGSLQQKIGVHDRDAGMARKVRGGIRELEERRADLGIIDRRSDLTTKAVTRGPGERLSQAAGGGTPSDAARFAAVVGSPQPGTPTQGAQGGQGTAAYGGEPNGGWGAGQRGGDAATTAASWGSQSPLGAPAPQTPATDATRAIPAVSPEARIARAARTRRGLLATTAYEQSAGAEPDSWRQESQGTGPDLVESPGERIAGLAGAPSSPEQAVPGSAPASQDMATQRIARVARTKRAVLATTTYDQARSQATPARSEEEAAGGELRERMDSYSKETKTPSERLGEKVRGTSQGPRLDAAGTLGAPSHMGAHARRKATRRAATAVATARERGLDQVERSEAAHEAYARSATSSARARDVRRLAGAAAVAAAGKARGSIEALADTEPDDAEELKSQITSGAKRARSRIKRRIDVGRAARHPTSTKAQRLATASALAGAGIQVPMGALGALSSGLDEAGGDVDTRLGDALAGAGRSTRGTLKELGLSAHDRRKANRIRARRARRGQRKAAKRAARNAAVSGAATSALRPAARARVAIRRLAAQPVKALASLFGSLPAAIAAGTVGLLCVLAFTVVMMATAAGSGGTAQAQAANPAQVTGLGNEVAWLATQCAATASPESRLKSPNHDAWAKLQDPRLDHLYAVMDNTLGKWGGNMAYASCTQAACGVLAATVDTGFGTIEASADPQSFLAYCQKLAGQGILEDVTSVGYNGVEPGDILCTNTHTAIWVGNDMAQTKFSSTDGNLYEADYAVGVYPGIDHYTQDDFNYLGFHVFRPLAQNVSGDRQFPDYRTLVGADEGMPASTVATSKQYREALIRKAQANGSDSDYLLTVDCDQYRLCVLHKTGSTWEVLRSWYCCVGKVEGGRSISMNWGQNTIQAKYDDAGEGQSVNPWMSSISGDKSGFGIHGAWADLKTYVAASGNTYANTPGGIVCETSAAKWIHDNCPVGTKVVVFDAADPKG